MGRHHGSSAHRHRPQRTPARSAMALLHRSAPPATTRLVWNWERYRPAGGTLVSVTPGHLERPLAASSRHEHMEISTALDIHGRGAHADSRSCVPGRRETAGSIRRATVEYDRNGRSAPACGMVENESENGIGAHWYLLSTNKIFEGLRCPTQQLLA